MTNGNPIDPYISGTEARKFLGVNRITLYRWAKEKDFPRPCVIAGRNYWRQSELVAFMESHRSNNKQPLGLDDQEGDE